MYKRKPEISIPQKSFPDDTSIYQIDTLAYGLQVGQAIAYEWFQRSSLVGASGTCRFYTNWLEFHRRRLYARAQQPSMKYKNAMATDGDLSYLNLDFTNISIIPKFVDIIVNGMLDREMTLKATSQDAASAEKKSKFQDQIEADMIAKDFLATTQEQFGVDAFNVDPKKLPEDSDELSLYMNLNYKPGIEIAEEIAIDTILQENHYNDTYSRFIKDIVEIGPGAVKHEFNKTTGIEVSYVDAANVIHSYTEDPFFKDVFYYGEPKQVHINELLKIDPNLTEADLREISEYSSAWADCYSDMKPYGIFQKDTATLLYFNYKTRKNFVYKRKKTKNGGEKPVLKDSSFENTPDSDLFEKSSVTKEVWYEGVMVLGSNRILKWEMSSNMVRPKSSTQHVMPNYIMCAPRMYKGEIESHVSRMIPFADGMQLTHLKLQQIKSKMIPDGVFIDIDGINEINLGNGGEYGPMEALRLYGQTGSLFGRGMTQDGDYNNSRIPIQELTKSSAAQKMQALVSDYNHQLSMIRDVTGLNEASDGSTPDPRALVGLQKMAALNSNTATRHILNAGMYITRTLAECLSLRIADVLEYSDMKEEFAMKIGKFNVAILDDIKDLPLCSFGISIELSPDVEEESRLLDDISLSLKEGKIELEDKIDILMIKNLKQANEMLKVRRRKRSKEAREREDVVMQMAAQNNEKSLADAAQNKLAQIQAETQGKIAVKQAESDFMIKTETAVAELKAQLMDKEFGYQMQLKGQEVSGQMTKLETAEDRKDKRVDIQSTQTSAIADQKQKGLPPINFESNNDNMDALDLSSFEPS